jgi:signal transduction histidine kinase
LWFGTRHHGVCRFDGIQLTCYDEKSGLAENYVEGITQDINGNIWILGEKTLVRFDGEVFSHYTQNEGMYFDYSSGIIDDFNGNIWIATYGTGLICLNDSTFIRFAEKEGLVSKYNFIVSKERNGDIWLGNTDYGASRISNNYIAHFSVSEVSMDNTISSFLEDHMGNLWMGTTYGLHFMKFDKTNFNPSVKNSISPKVNIQSYRKPEGLKDLFITPNAMLFDSKNRMWIGAAKGPIMIDLDDFYIKKSKQQIFLRNIVINGIFKDFRSHPENNEKSVTYTGVKPYENLPINLKLPYKQNRLTFHFSVQFEQPQHKVLYSYRLVGVDKSWTAPNPDPKADYQNLPHGIHTFQVKAIGDSLEWTDVLEYQFTILPPWWHTWWAYVIYAFLFLSGLYFFSKWRERKLRIEKEKLELIVYERTTELKESLDHLNSTQSQLIQAEKMASLGELTAGIAHEIQNPLNFVNNFSEVSSELIDEMNEVLDEGNIEEAKEISQDLKQNLEKINHHGKRADAIVKGMLDHSRTNSGEKIPTDINALCDEYLRLSYHGLRAKDKSFNAAFETAFDPDLPKINVVVQDIGRVLLNLINNAFYAVNERSKEGLTGYKPRVEVSTRQVENGIIISVKDNGNGIPEHIKDKIFQPFFTTKPTGQGTGLGLSLSYDIVKVHGGTIAVNSLRDQGTEFIITLPI